MAAASSFVLCCNCLRPVCMHPWYQSICSKAEKRPQDSCPQASTSRPLQLVSQHCRGGPAGWQCDASAPIKIVPMKHLLALPQPIDYGIVDHTIAGHAQENLSPLPVPHPKHTLVCPDGKGMLLETHTPFCNAAPLQPAGLIQEATAHSCKRLSGHARPWSDCIT